MPDPIWLDNNIVDRAVKGDVDIRNKLAAYRSQGRPLLITPWVRMELLYGGKKIGKGMTPANIVMTEGVMKSLGIELDSSGAKIGFQKFREYYNTKLPRGGISNTDRMVLTEVKACAEARGVKAPELMTAEINKKAMAANTKPWGVVSVVHAEPFKPPTTTAPVKPPGGGSSGGSGSSGASGAPPAASGSGTGGAPPPTGSAKPAGTQGAAGGSPATTVKADQAKSRSLAPKAPNIRIEDFPPERKGPVTRFFDDKPVLNKAGLFAANTSANALKGGILDKVAAHFVAAAENGTSEFRSSFPAPATLSKGADLDTLHKAATQALVAVVSTSGGPPDPRPFGTDRVAAMRALSAWLRKQNTKAAATRAYDKAAQAYIDRLTELTNKVAKLREPLQPIADDIGKRASILLDAGNELETLFWQFVPVAAVSPITYYEWFDVHTVAGVFLSVGATVSNLAMEIRTRMAEYDAMLAALYNELQAASEALAVYAPDGG